MILAPNDIHLWLSPDKGLGSEKFIRNTLSEYLLIPPAQIRLAKTAHGKPYLKDRRLRGLQFNLSDSHGAMVCAVGYGEALGVDIEYPARKNRLDEISQRYFHPQEVEALQAVTDEAERRALFFQLWTSKEAYIKAMGLTIGTASLDKVAFSCQNNEIQPLFNTPSHLRWHFDHLPLHTPSLHSQAGRDYVITTATAYKAWQGIKPQIRLFEM